jgi:hypothetical protein
MLLAAPKSRGIIIGVSKGEADVGSARDRACERTAEQPWRRKEPRNEEEDRAQPSSRDLNFSISAMKYKNNHRPKVPSYIKIALCQEAGNKCANPGCPNALIELHHINLWHVYQTHSQTDMIAVCPTCHDNAHRGTLVIDDHTIRRWKLIHRPLSKRSHIYIEPGEDVRVLLGSVYMTNGASTPDGLVIFDLSPHNRLSFRIIDGDVLLTNLVVTDSGRYELVRVVDGYLKHNIGEPFRYESRVGKHRITAPATAAYVPAWLVEKYNEQAPAPSAEDGRFTVLDIEVLDRGCVQIQGVWAEDRRAVVIAQDWLSICTTRKDGLYT